jgi:hypothetical protein
MGFTKIIRTENAGEEGMHNAFKNVTDELRKGHTDKTGKIKVLLFVYYSGHGVMDTTTKIVLNEENSDDRYYALESKLSCVSQYRNTFTVALFDCCREQLPPEEIRGGEPVANVSQNFYVTFGCAPTHGVLAKSPLVELYTTCVKKHLNKNSGVWLMPQCLEYFKSDYMP